MTRMDKNQVYDELSKVLTNYEWEDYECDEYMMDDFYSILFKIHTNWEELTGDDDE